MHNKPWEKMKERKPFLISNPFFFFYKFSCRSHYLNYPLFKQAFFVKTFPFSTPFYSWHVIIFLLIFKSSKEILFFWRKWIRHSFFRFVSSFIQNKTLPYFEKETKWETIFLCFSKIQNTHFLFWQSQIFRILISS